LTQEITIPRQAKFWQIGAGVAVAPGKHDELEMDWPAAENGHVDLCVQLPGTKAK
jgi:hypothetical protein